MLIHDDPRHYIQSLDQFLFLVNSSFTADSLNYSRWTFRGHGNYDYQLLPSIGRLLGTPTFEDKDSLFFLETHSFRRFRVSSYRYLKDNNKTLMLSAAQHHGMKTRLLDWTFSPLVALFFAVENSEDRSDGAIIAYRAKEFLSIIDLPNLDPLKINRDLFLIVPSITERIAAQQGVLQVFTDPTIPFDDTISPPQKLRIPGSAKESIKVALYTAGITYETLFPDLDGICKTINQTMFTDGRTGAIT